MPTRTGTVAAAGLMVLALKGPPVRAAAPGLVSFQIEDQLDERELEETTTLYVNARAIGTFHLNRRNPEVTLNVTVPRADGYEVALCGSITFRNEDGRPEMHRVDSVGQMQDVEGRVFEALGAADFTEFYLVDRTRSRPPIEPERGNGGICVPATS